MHEELKEASMIDIVKQIKELEAEIKIMTDVVNLLNNDLAGLIEVDLKVARLNQGKDTGTINLLKDGVEIKEVISKKVKWDQDKLLDLEAKIIESGDNPGLYMTVNRSISEKDYKSFSPEIQEAFLPARTVTPGKPKLTFKIKED